MNKKITQSEIIMEFFHNNPNREIHHPEVVDWATKEYQKRMGKVFRDPDRQIRVCHQKGLLIKIDKGVYKYDPEFVENRDLEDFSARQKQEILARDGYRCVMCGKGEQEGEELHVDHIMPKEKGGRAIIINGQTLCATHNFRKRILGQTETGKKMFIRLYEIAKLADDTETVSFLARVLEIFEEYDVNGHIEWKK